MIKCGITGFKGNLGKTFLKVNKKISYIKFKGDISKKKEVYTWVEKNEFDILIHLAARVSTAVVNKNFKKALDVNYNGTKYLVDATIKYKKDLKWFFFASTSHVYSLQKKLIKENFKCKPSSNYGKTKFFAENYIKRRFKNKNIKFCIGRIFSIFDNTNASFFTPSLIKKIKQRPKEIILDNLNHYRDFLTTKQISKIIIFLCQKKFQGVINIGSGRKTNLKEIAQVFANIKNKRIVFNHNKPTYLVADINKLKKLGFKTKKINYLSFFN